MATGSDLPGLLAAVGLRAVVRVERALHALGHVGRSLGHTVRLRRPDHADLAAVEPPRLIL
jgi:hypothetical protein